MSEEKIIKLFTDGDVSMGDKSFTRLMGGFGNNKPIFTAWQAGDLLNLPTSKIVENYTRNASKFQVNVDFKDLKSAIPQKDSQKVVDITKFLKDVGYSQSKLNATKQWLIFSYSGMMKLVKIATTKESWEIYDRFLEDYFKTKAENQVMKDSIEDELAELEEDRYKISGLAVFNPIQDNRIEAQKRLLNLDNRIAKMKSAIDNKQIQEALKNQSLLTKRKHGSKFVSQGDFGERFNNKIGSKTIGKLFKIVGLAKKSCDKTMPYQEFVPKYAVNIINNEREIPYEIYYKWNYELCSSLINKWLLNHDYIGQFYSLTEKEEIKKFIDQLYDKYINHIEVAELN